MSIALSSLLLGAALALPLNKVVTPGLGNRVVIRTQASLTSQEDNGEFAVEVLKHDEATQSPGESVENLRVLPRKLFLRDGSPRRLTLSFDSLDLEPGPLWICIAAKPKVGSSVFSKSLAQVQIRTRSCYQRILQKRR